MNVYFLNTKLKLSETGSLQKMEAIMLNSRHWMIYLIKKHPEN